MWEKKSAQSSSCGLTCSQHWHSRFGQPSSCGYCPEEPTGTSKGISQHPSSGKMEPSKKKRGSVQEVAIFKYYTGELLVFCCCVWWTCGGGGRREGPSQLVSRIWFFLGNIFFARGMYIYLVHFWVEILCLWMIGLVFMKAFRVNCPSKLCPKAQQTSVSRWRQKFFSK